MSSATPAHPGADADGSSYVRTWTKAPVRWFRRSDGSRLRYVVTGTGDPLVLLHTVRTQLDQFQRMIPLLEERYTVYALDFPGMGWSDIVPAASYNHDDLLAAVQEFMAGLGLERVTMAGESMGAVVALSAARVMPERITRVVASNTYDYRPGLERANLMAQVIIPAIRLPLLGAMFAALENRAIVKGIVSGGYADARKFPEPYLDELVRVGGRRGYPRVARAIYRNLGSLVAARTGYPRVQVPVDLIYSQSDWSREPDRQRTAAALPQAVRHEVDHAGHFLSMERPAEFARIIVQAPANGQTQAVDE